MLPINIVVYVFTSLAMLAAMLLVVTHRLARWVSISFSAITGLALLAIGYHFAVNWQEPFSMALIETWKILIFAATAWIFIALALRVFVGIFVRISEV